jgi:DNA-binding ferritin-like protein
MDDIYSKLAKEIAELRGGGNTFGADDAFSSNSFDAYLGGKVEGKTAYIQGTDEQLDLLKDGMLNLLALLRAQYWMYQHAHWQVGGESFYGDHLLFTRLYESVSEEIDTLAEKAVGYLGMDVMTADDLMRRAQMWVDRWSGIECPHRRSLKTEEDFQHFAKNFYEVMDNLGVLTLGLDDFVQAMSSNHETHTYLLQQKLAFRESHEGKRALELAKAAKTVPPRKVAFSGERRKVANLGDLSDFIRVGKSTLIHKSDEDFWQLKKDADGNHVIERMVDNDVLGY